MVGGGGSRHAPKQDFGQKQLEAVAMKTTKVNICCTGYNSRPDYAHFPSH